MTLLQEIQNLLERTYAPIGCNLEQCLVGATRCRILSKQAGGLTDQFSSKGRTFLSQKGESLSLAIFYAPELIEELEGNDPRQSLNERNIGSLITFIEEIAHGVQAGLLFLAGERALTSEDFASNLEAQAKIDTFLVLSRLASLLTGAPLPKKVNRWLERQLFDRSYLRFKSKLLRERYGEAQKVARQFVEHLRRFPIEERQPILRYFRGLSWKEKQAFLAKGSR